MYFNYFIKGRVFLKILFYTRQEGVYIYILADAKVRDPNMSLTGG
jgi:hypothetical protein